MRLRVSELGEGRFEVAREIALPELRALLHGKDDDPVRPLGALSYSVALTRNKRQVRLTGTLEVPLWARCTRCNAEIEHTLRLKLSELFVPAPVPDPEAPIKRKIDLVAEDFESQTYENDEIDLDRYLADSVLLEFPEFPLCAGNPDCEDGKGDYLEDWGVSETEMNSNPVWKASLEAIKKEMTKKPRAKGKKKA